MEFGPCRPPFPFSSSTPLARHITNDDGIIYISNTNAVGFPEAPPLQPTMVMTTVINNTNPHVSTMMGSSGSEPLQPSLKRQRNSDDNEDSFRLRNAAPATSIPFVNNSQQLAVQSHPGISVNMNGHQNNCNFNNGGGKSKLFFKTRICASYREGSCPYGDNCTFAHGFQEIRSAAPNWRQQQHEQHRDNPNINWKPHKICNKYNKPEGCPYGEKCTFLHPVPEQQSDAFVFGFRESSIVNTTTMDRLTDNKSKSDSSRIGFPVTPLSQNHASTVPSLLKTKTCNNWEMTGTCSYGERCIYSHGRAVDLKRVKGIAEVERMTGGDLANSVPIHDDLPGKIEPSSNTQIHKAKVFYSKDIKWRSRIYGDWIEDVSS